METGDKVLALPGAKAVCRIAPLLAATGVLGGFGAWLIDGTGGWLVAGLLVTTIAAIALVQRRERTKTRHPG
ncbi:MAG: hypothetical protein AB7Q76_01140 [Gammaproteobacteria bacterium]